MPACAGEYAKGGTRGAHPCPYWCITPQKYLDKINDIPAPRYRAKGLMAKTCSLYAVKSGRA